MDVVVNFEEKERKFLKYYQENFNLHSSALKVFENLVEALVINGIEIDSTSSRIKDYDGCIDKFKEKYLKKFEENNQDYEIKDSITDLLGIRVVCLYISDFDYIKSHIEANFFEIDITDKTAQIESTENEFGYKRLHLDLKLNDSRCSLPEYEKFKDLRFELQIRTIIQDAWSVLDHKIKYKKAIPNSLKRGINRLSALFEIADEEFLRIRNETKQEVEKVEHQIEPDKDPEPEPLNVFTFLSIAKAFFPQYSFEDSKAGGFVEEILKYTENYKTINLYKAIVSNIAIVETYSDQQYMNPYTFMRHILYNSDKNVFQNILYATQKREFDKWLVTYQSPQAIEWA